MKKAKLIVLSVAVLLILSAVFSAAQAGEGPLANAKRMIDQGSYADAIVMLRGQLSALGPQRPQAQFWLGVAYNRILDYDRAAAALVAAKSGGFNHPDFHKEAGLNLWGRGEKAMALMQLRQAAPKDAEAAYYRGLAAAGLGKGGEAAAAFKAAGADPRFAGKVAAYLKATQGGKEARSWGGSLHVGLEYNDDVSQAPSTVGLPADLSSRDDLALLYTLRGWWTFYRRDDWNIGVGANLGGAHYLELDDFSFLDGGVNLYVKKMLRPFQLRVNGGFTHSRVGGDGNANAFYLTPGISWQPLPITWTDLDARLSTTDYLHDDRANQVSNGGALDGMLMNSSLTLAQSLKLKGLLFSGLTTFFQVNGGYLSNQAGGRDSESSGCRFGIMASQELPKGFRLILDLNWRRLDYDRNPYPNHPGNGSRSDDTLIAGARLVWKIKPKLSVYLGWRYVENDSNIPDYYSYDRNTFTTGVVFSF